MKASAEESMFTRNDSNETLVLDDHEINILNRQKDEMWEQELKTKSSFLFGALGASSEGGLNTNQDCF
jgi:hypothetical protein